VNKFFLTLLNTSDGNKTMNPNVNDHPAVKLGSWLEAKRRSRNFNAREFAGRICISPAKYAEIELGIGRWISERTSLLIVTALGLDYNEEAEFCSLRDAAQECSALQFSDRFTREQLMPMRLCHPSNDQPTENLTEKILDAVFAPIE
jgi:transcriptional regulator with XRE-family HTH domain